MCEQLIGPPTQDRGDGESHWECPKCSGDKFHTLPRKDGCKDRFKCWHCDFWGDEADMLKHFHPDDTYDDRLGRLNILRNEYDKLPPANTAKPDVIVRGAAGSTVARQAHPCAIENSWYDLSDDEISVLMEARRIVENNTRHDVTFYDLTDYQIGYERAMEMMGKAFAAECQDPLCDFAPCRKAHGLPPLTREESQAKIDDGTFVDGH